MGGKVLAVLLLAGCALGAPVAPGAPPAGAKDAAPRPKAPQAKAPAVPLATARANGKANGLLHDGKFAEAAKIYQAESLKRPEISVLQANLASAQARAGQGEESLLSSSQALRFADNDAERARVLYDLGNTLAASGQVKPALEAYAQAMLLDPADLDSRHNFEFLLSQSQQQDQQQEGQDQDPNQPQKDQNEQSQGEQQQTPQQPNAQQEQQQNQPQPQTEQGKDEQMKPQSAQEDEAMDPQDAKRLLEAMLEEEKELQAALAKKQIKPSHNVEKDW